MLITRGEGVNLDIDPDKFEGYKAMGYVEVGKESEKKATKKAAKEGE